MLDIKLIRENPKEIQSKINDRGVDIDINLILNLDKKQKELSFSVQKLREERNKAGKDKNIEKGKEVKEKLQTQEEELRSLQEKLLELMLKIPNLSLSGVPVGDKIKNRIIKKTGLTPKLNFTPKDHLEIGEKLDLIDVKRASKVSGTRFGYLKNEAVLLEFALVQYVLAKLIPQNFIPVVPPALIKKDITEGLGYWSAGNHNNYYLVTDYEEVSLEKVKENPLYLIGTGEHAVVSMHKDEVFSKNELPKRYIIFSPCFRREAGTYGRDTRGIFRVHQFDKLEMVSFVKPQDDEKERKKLLKIAEELVKDLGLSYQTIKLSTQDMSFPTAETIDIETWIPSQNKYRETNSISTTTDFQARRLNIKYQEDPKAGGEKNYVHILNGTAMAIGRIIIAILENFQQKDGSVKIPKVLQKYIGKVIINPKK